jgi:hypothetical protein
MSNESENDDFEEKMDMVRETTSIINTPDPDNKGKFWLYSTGMRDNHELPDLEIRDVPGMFTGAAASTINTINAYRLGEDSKPLEVGHTMQWKYGDIRVEQGESFDGALTWEAEDMLRLVSRLTDIECCHSCECHEAGVTE